MTNTTLGEVSRTSSNKGDNCRKTTFNKRHNISGVKPKPKKNFHSQIGKENRPANYVKDRVERWQVNKPHKGKSIPEKALLKPFGRYDGVHTQKRLSPKKDLRRTVLAYGMDRNVKKEAILNTVTKHGDVKAIYMESENHGPDKETCQRIMRKKLLNTDQLSDVSDRACAFIVFSSQGQATKLVKAMRDKDRSKKSLQMWCIHQYDYIKVLRKVDSESLSHSDRQPSPSNSFDPRSSPPASWSMTAMRRGPVNKGKFRPRSAPGPRPQPMINGKGRRYQGKYRTPSLRFERPTMEDASSEDSKFECSALGSPALPAMVSYQRDGSRCNTKSQTDLPRIAAPSRFLSVTPRKPVGAKTSRGDFAIRRVAMGPPDLETKGFCWSRTASTSPAPSSIATRSISSSTQHEICDFQLDMDQKEWGDEALSSCDLMAAMMMYDQFCERGRTPEPYIYPSPDPKPAGAPLDPTTPEFMPKSTVHMRDNVVH